LKKNPEGSTYGHLMYLKDHSFEVIKVVKENTLVPPLIYVTPKNLHCTYLSNNFRIHDPQKKYKFIFEIKIIYL